MRRAEPWWRAPILRAYVLLLVAAAVGSVCLTGCPRRATQDGPRSRPVAERPTPRADPLKALAARAARHKDRRGRQDAVRALAKLGTRAAAEAMIEALDGSSLWLRPTVADALITMPPKVLAGLEVAIEVLVAELRPKQKIRFRKLAHGLAAVGDAAVIALLRVLPGLSTSPVKASTPQSAAAEVRRQLAAKGALVLLGDKIVPTLLRLAKEGLGGVNRSFLDLALADVLGSMGQVALPRLIAHLGQKGRLGTLAKHSIRRMGPAAAPALMKLLYNPAQTADLRTELVVLLSGLEDAKVQQALLPALMDPDRGVAEAAARALAKNPSEKAFVALAQRIKSGTVAQRLAIVKGASKGKGERSIRLLRLVLIQGGETEALAAARALGDRGDKGAVTALLQLLKRPSVKLRTAAIRALGVLRVPRTFKTLARLARRGNKALRLAAIAALGSFGSKAAKRLLGRLKRSRNKAVAKAASEALAPPGLAVLGGSLGIPECDAYLKIMACYVQLVPAAARGPLTHAIRKSMAAWRKMANSSARGTLGKTCRMARQAFTKAVMTNQRFRKCVQP